MRALFTPVCMECRTVAPVLSGILLVTGSIWVLFCSTVDHSISLMKSEYALCHGCMGVVRLLKIFLEYSCYWEYMGCCVGVMVVHSILFVGFRIRFFAMVVWSVLWWLKLFLIIVVNWEFCSLFTVSSFEIRVSLRSVLVAMVVHSFRLVLLRYSRVWWSMVVHSIQVIAAWHVV